LGHRAKTHCLPIQALWKSFHWEEADASLQLLLEMLPKKIKEHDTLTKVAQKSECRLKQQQRNDLAYIKAWVNTTLIS